MHKFLTVKFILIFNVGALSYSSKIFESVHKFSEPPMETQIQLLDLFEKMYSINLIIRKPNQFSNIYAELLLKTHSIPLQISSQNFKNKKAQAIVAVSDLKSLDSDINLFYSYGTTLLLIIPSKVKDITILEDVLKKSWLFRKTLDVFILINNAIFGYNPFFYNFDVKGYGKIVKFKSDDYTRMFYDLNGYPVIIENFKSVYSQISKRRSSKNKTVYRGADIKLVRLIKKKMNFTLIQHPGDRKLFGYLTTNGTFNGALGRLIRREIDIALTGFFIKSYKTEDIEFTAGAYSDKLCVIVPKAQLIPQSILPLFSLNFNMWMLFGLTAIFGGTFWCILRYINVKLHAHKKNISRKKLWNKQQILQMYVDTLIVWVRVNLNKFPEFRSEKLFVISLSLLSVLLIATFESSLATGYIKPLHYPDINTLEDLDRSGLKIKYKYVAMKDDAFANVSKLFRNLDKKMILIKNLQENIKKNLAEKGGFATISRHSLLKLDINVLTTGKIHKIPKCPKTYIVAYVLPKKSAYYKQVNYLLLYALNGGLINKWIKDTNYRFLIRNQLKENFKIPRLKILTLNDLQLSFFIILAGNFAATLVLFVEISIWRKINK